MIRIGTAKMLTASRHYTCKSAKCGNSFQVYADMEQGHLLQPPKACPRVGERPAGGATSMMEAGWSHMSFPPPPAPFSGGLQVH